MPNGAFNQRPDIQGGPTAGSTALDGPPPTMGLETPQTPPAGIADLVPRAPVQAGQVPEPIRAGAEELNQQLMTGVDSLAQLFPEFAADFGIVRIALERAMGKVSAAAGTQAVTPTAPGPGFPGGGLGSAPVV